MQRSAWSPGLLGLVMAFGVARAAAAQAWPSARLSYHKLTASGHYATNGDFVDVAYVAAKNGLGATFATGNSMSLHVLAMKSLAGSNTHRDAGASCLFGSPPP